MPTLFLFCFFLFQQVLGFRWVVHFGRYHYQGTCMKVYFCKMLGPSCVYQWGSQNSIIWKCVSAKKKSPSCEYHWGWWESSQLSNGSLLAELDNRSHLEESCLVSRCWLVHILVKLWTSYHIDVSPLALDSLGTAGCGVILAILPQIQLAWAVTYTMSPGIIGI